MTCAERQADKPDCEVCRALRAGKEIDCSECVPELLLSNFEAWNIFLIVHKQVIFSPDGKVLDVNHLAVWKAIEEYGVEDRISVFEKVVVTFRAMVRKSANEVPT